MKATVLIAAACVVLTGCPSAPVDPRARECLIEKDTNVRVMDDKYIVVDRDPIVICKKNQKIRWVLDPNQPYRFVAEGVTVDDGGDNEFDNCRPQGRPGDWEQGGLSFKCHNKNDKHDQGLKPRYYKYTITLQKKGGTPISVDPHIMND